jgi:hypothetical protein
MSTNPTDQAREIKARVSAMDAVNSALVDANSAQKRVEEATANLERLTSKARNELNIATAELFVGG